MSKRDSKLRETDLSRRPSFFFRTYFMDNFLANGFDNDIRYKYVENVWYWSQEQDLFCHKNIFVPIHIVDTYCILEVISIFEKRIQIYDKVNSDKGHKYLAILFRYIKEEHQFRYGSTLPNQEKWIFVHNQPLLLLHTENGTFNCCYRYLLILVSCVQLLITILVTTMIICFNFDALFIFSYFSLVHIHTLLFVISCSTIIVESGIFACVVADWVSTNRIIPTIVPQNNINEYRKK